jgi:hypothetical protein
MNAFVSQFLSAAFVIYRPLHLPWRLKLLWTDKVMGHTVLRRLVDGWPSALSLLNYQLAASVSSTAQTSVVCPSRMLVPTTEREADPVIRWASLVIDPNRTNHSRNHNERN